MGFKQLWLLLAAEQLGVSSDEADIRECAREFCRSVLEICGRCKDLVCVEELCLALTRARDTLLDESVTTESLGCFKTVVEPDFNNFKTLSKSRREQLSRELGIVHSFVEGLL